MKTKILIIITALIPLIYFGFASDHFPNQVIVHWNINGQADRYGSASMYLILALMPLICFIFFELYNHLKTISNNKKYSTQMIGALIVFLSIISILFTSQATNEQLQFLKILIIMFGALFIFIGNMMNKLKRNAVLGIRIPATLRSEKVWNRTHYLGGYGFVITGVLTIFSSIIFIEPATSMYVMIILLLILALTLGGYAEVLYRRETGHSSLSK